MTPKEKSNDLVDTFRIVLMNEDTDCGNENIMHIDSQTMCINSR